jgi:hypothetical protein
VAGREAARRAQRGDDPALMVVFSSGVDDPAGLLAGIEEACPGVPLIGCSADRLVAPAHEASGVLITTLGGPGFTVRTAASPTADGTQRAGGAAVARCAADLPDTAPDGRALLLLTDGSVPDQEEILAGAYAVVGASVPLVGGSASADARLGLPFQLCGREVLRRATVGAVVASDGPFGFGVRHGCRTVGEPMIVTRSADGEVHTLDDRPALSAYLERYGAPATLYADPRAFDDFAETRPIGIRRRFGVEVRAVAATAGPPAGRLRASGEVPEGGLVWPMQGELSATVESAADAFREAVDGLGGAAPLGLLAFDCVSRFHILGEDGMRREMTRMVDESGDRPVSGFYTWGEILRSRGLNGYHNHTLAVFAVG